MIIEIETKGGALAATFSNVDGPVPRPGDIVANLAYAELLGGVTTVLVIDVVYEHTADLLTPRVRCRPVGNDASGDRLLWLKENGWLDTPE